MLWFAAALGVVAGVCLTLGAIAAGMWLRRVNDPGIQYEVLDRPIDLRPVGLPYLAELEEDPLVLINLRTGRQSSLLS